MTANHGITMGAAFGLVAGAVWGDAGMGLIFGAALGLVFWPLFAPKSNAEQPPGEAEDQVLE
jgi:mannose/fructose/N-acetylgalactosamine-specific phosphotransferase system component IIC